MPKTVKSVAKGYAVNINYDLDPRRLESVINVLEESKKNLSKSHVAHIVLQVENKNFNKSLINETLKHSLGKELNTGFGYFICLEESRKSSYHIHLMLTFSAGDYLTFTILSKAVEALYALDEVKTAIAIPRKTDKSISIDTVDYYNSFKTIKNDSKYFHELDNEVELKDAVYRYSYLTKSETKKHLQGMRLTQSKLPKAYKTKQGQKTRKNKIKKDNNHD
jgi:hypothetical protein